jgi:CBS domain-containing protein
VPVCRLSDRIGAVRERLAETGWDQCLVVNEQRIVLGRVRRRNVDAPAETPVEEVMESGPTTTRPDERLTPLLARLRERKVGSIVVATSDGRLVGVVRKEDAEHAESPAP